MSHITWTDDLSVGIREIDTQHRRIVDYINHLHALHDHPDRAVVGEVIEDLLDYTFTHFAFEETVMEDGGYSLIEPHRKIHEKFSERIKGFKTRYAAGENVADELCDMLAAWLFDHIREDDKSYASVLNKNPARN